MTRPRMLVLHPSDELYGADRVLLETVASASGWEVVVALPRDATDGGGPLAAALRERGAEVRVCDWPVLRRRYVSSPAGVLLLTTRAVRVLRELRVLARGADVVLLSTTAALPARVLMGWRRRVLVHVQEVWTRRERLLLGSLLRGAQVVVISDHVRASLPRKARAAAVRVWNGVPDPGPPAMTIGGHPINLLVTGRWTSGKGYESLFAALRVAGRADLHLVVLGGPPSLGAGIDVRQLDGGSATQVEFVGEIEDPGPYLCAADVVLVPSLTPEGLGLAAIEGLAHGRPVVASDAGGLTEVVTEECGWTYPAGSASALAEVLVGLTPEQARTRGAAGRARYEQHFSATRYRSEMGQQLASLLGQASA